MQRDCGGDSEGVGSVNGQLCVLCGISPRSQRLKKLEPQSALRTSAECAEKSVRLWSNSLHIAAILISIALCVAGYVYIFKGIQEQLQIQHDINLKLPPDQQFEPTFWTMVTWQKFRSLQNQLLPGDPRPRRLRGFQVMGFGLLALGLLLLLMTLKM